MKYLLFIFIFFSTTIYAQQHFPLERIPGLYVGDFMIPHTHGRMSDHEELYLHKDGSVEFWMIDVMNDEQIRRKGKWTIENDTIYIRYNHCTINDEEVDVDYFHHPPNYRYQEVDTMYFYSVYEGGPMILCNKNFEKIRYQHNLYKKEY